MRQAGIGFFFKSWFLFAFLFFRYKMPEEVVLTFDVRFEFTEMEVRFMKKEYLTQLRDDYPVYVPLTLAAELLGISPRQLSRLVVAGRKPYSDIGANIGTTQNYVRIYTERLLRYLTGNDLIC